MNIQETKPLEQPRRLYRVLLKHYYLRTCASSLWNIKGSTFLLIDTTKRTRDNITRK